MMNTVIENIMSRQTIREYTDQQVPDELLQIVLDADLNFMMKALLGGKIKEALDKVVDALVAMSEGRMPEGVDPSMFGK